MPQLKLTVQTITPLLMYGANNKDDPLNKSIKAAPELRAPSIRGILRYWLRAVLGAQYRSLSDLYQQESNILGSTEQGSRVKISVSRSMHAQENQTVLPHQTRGRMLTHTGYPADSEFRIILSTHPLDNSAVLSGGSDLIKAVFLMAHIGGLGKRSRRGSGNLRVVKADGYDGNLPLAVLPENRTELVDYLSEVSQHISSGTVTVGHRPDFPVFASDTALVLVGRKTHPSYEDAFAELWQVSGPYHNEHGIFGDVRPRRASAIHMRVAATNSGYVAQQTILYCGSGQWDHMKTYINDCLNADFDEVYGTWRGWK